MCTSEVMDTRWMRGEYGIGEMEEDRRGREEESLIWRPEAERRWQYGAVKTAGRIGLT